MIKPEEMFHFIDNYENPVYIIDIKENTIIYHNTIATNTYDLEGYISNSTEILQNKREIDHEEAKKNLKTKGFSVYYDIYTSTKEGKSQLVDLELQYFDKAQTKIYVEIRKKLDKRMDMVLYQINQSHRPEALLHFDEKLSIIHCNEPFHKVFESSEELRHSHFKNDLVNGFLPEIREKLICSIIQGLSVSSFFSTKIKVYTAKGEERWYLFELEKRILDNSGEDKIFAYMTNIEKQVEVEEQFALTNQYLSVLQKSTVDILYRVDIPNNIMYHYSNFTEGVGIEKAIPDYVNVFIREKTIHPEDKELYLEDFKNFYENDMEPQNAVRFSVGGQEYQWYKITAEKIYDKDGTLKEVFGALVNVEKEHQIQEKFSSLHQYYETMKTLSDESLYIFDLKTRMLHLGGLTVTELGLPDTLSGYPESIHYLIHPKDLDKFIAFSQRALGENQDKLELRFQNTDGNYQWYELRSSVIFDENDRAIEILGRIKNIQNSKKMQAEVHTFHRYFDIMQEFSADILYRIDVATQTLYLAYQSELSLRVGSVVPQYMETLVEQKIVHPEDAEMYVENVKAWLVDDSIKCELRLNLVSEEYQWYTVKRKKIFDDQGNLIEIFGALMNIHKERELADKFEETNQYFTTMQALSDDIFYRVEVDTMTLHHSLASIQKITQNSAIPDYVNAFIQEKVIHPDDVEKYLKDLESFFAGNLSDITARFALLSEEYHWYRARSRKIFDENGNVAEIWGRLISEQEEKVAHEKLSEISQYFNAMQKLSDDVLFHIDIATNTFSHSDESALGFGVPTEIPNFVEVFIEQGYVREEDGDIYREYIQKLFSGELMNYQIQVAVALGVYEWFDVKCEFIYDLEGNAIEIFGKMQNIQKRKTLEERAYHDMMTGALNKATFEEEVAEALSSSEPEEQHALIFIDLDDFKNVNDTLGHSYGDSLLATVGKRLRRLVRGDDIVGRIGGDEFAVMLRNIDNEDSVLMRTNLMLATLQKDFSFEKKVIGIKASVGLAVYPQHGKNYKDLIGKADLAVYESKRRGKNVVSLYTTALEVE